MSRKHWGGGGELMAGREPIRTDGRNKVTFQTGQEGEEPRPEQKGMWHYQSWPLPVSFFLMASLELA